MWKLRQRRQVVTRIRILASRPKSRGKCPRIAKLTCSVSGHKHDRYLVASSLEAAKSCRACGVPIDVAGTHPYGRGKMDKIVSAGARAQVGVPREPQATTTMTREEPGDRNHFGKSPSMDKSSIIKAAGTGKRVKRRVALLSRYRSAAALPPF